MKSLNQFVNEQKTFQAFRINQDYKPEQTKYLYFPKKRIELRKIIEKRLEEDPNADLNDIDVSKIIDMEYLFSNLDPHNIDISEWDVSKVKNMSYMFSHCKNLNCDLSDWDVSNVEWMPSMFYGCKSFEGKTLENWDISNINDDNDMFGALYECKSAPSWYIF